MSAISLQACVRNMYIVQLEVFKCYTVSTLVSFAMLFALLRGAVCLLSDYLLSYSPRFHGGLLQSFWPAAYGSCQST